MKIQIELTGEVHHFEAIIKGAKYKTDDATEASLKKLWMLLLDAEVFNTEDEENGIQTYDEEYWPCDEFPFSISDLVITEHHFSSDAYYHVIDY